MKKLSFLCIAVILTGATAFAGHFEFVDPGFEERVLTEQVQDGESILINVNTVAVDNRGNVYYLKSDLEQILGEQESYTFQEMEEIEYTVKVAGINRLGEEGIFAEGRFPLKTTVAGIYFDGVNRRLLVFLKTLSVREECPFLLSASVSSVDARPASGEQDARTWDWSGLENCIMEKVSILEITGFESVTTFAY